MLALLANELIMAIAIARLMSGPTTDVLIHERRTMVAL
jgi:hypothetical protein